MMYKVQAIQSAPAVPPTTRMIAYPCCPKEKIFLDENTHGKTSNKCPSCGRFVEFDYDLMTAHIIPAKRGAVKALTTAGNPS